MRVAVAQFSHETCTFCPDPTTIDRLEPHVVRGPAILDKAAESSSYISGFANVAREEADMELLPIVSVGMAPGPYTSWMDLECFDKYTNEIAEAVRNMMPVDGVLLALHGAMAVREIPRPEAEITRRVRETVGDHVPIMVTLDLHANEDEALARYSDGIFILKTYPHLDSEEIGETAARCLAATVKGQVKPRQALRRPGILSASIYQASEYPPMKTIYDRCREWEKTAGVICVSVAPGYAYADVVDAGMSVVAVTDDDLALAQTIAEDVSSLAWDLREEFSRPLPKPAAAVTDVMRLVDDGQRPVIIADGSDRTGDGTHVLRELLEQGAKNFVIAGIADAACVTRLERDAALGQSVEVSVGGQSTPLAGEPVRLQGKVEYLGRPQYTLVGPMQRGRKVEEGLVAWLNLGDNRHVVVGERMRGANDESGLTALGIDVSTLDIIVLKDRVHHRAYWDQVAEVDVPVDAPGLGPADLTVLEYKNVPNDIYPIGSKWR